MVHAQRYALEGAIATRGKVHRVRLTSYSSTSIDKIDDSPRVIGGGS